VSARKKRRASACLAASRTSGERQRRTPFPSRKALSIGVRTAQAPFRQIRSERRRRRKPVTLKQVLRTVMMIQVLHLSDFDYPRQPASPRAGVARMLAELSVRLADAVTRGGLDS
jgi:hypothetical protein